jgi:hypothetical protein
MKTRPWIDVSELAQPSDPDAQLAIDAASQILFQLSGQKYAGIFEVTEQYTCETTGAPVGCYWDAGEKAYWNPFVGTWVYVMEPGRGRQNRLLEGEYIKLRGVPVTEIVSVSIGGSALPSASYELLNASIVGRVGDGYSWGLCSSPVITYRYGVAPPALGRIAARRLANELILSLQGGDCRLPSTVTSVSRQGMSFEIIDPQQFLDGGKLGVYEIDLFLATVNPGKAKKRPRVFSPDMRRPYRRH